MIDYNVNTAEPVDIRDVSVDLSLPKHERIASYVRQVKNPYYVKYGNITIKQRFTKDGPTLADCFYRLSGLGEPQTRPS